MNWPQMDDSYQVDLPALFVWYCYRCGSFICACEGEARLESQFGIVEAIHGMKPARELSDELQIVKDDSVTKLV